MSRAAGVSGERGGLAGPVLPPLAAELLDVVQLLSVASELPTVRAVVLHAVRRITGADGVTFVVRDGDHCSYVDEDAIAPLWKGQRFPAHTCISGWAMDNGVAAVIPDITLDERIPQDLYLPTFVRSLAMVPIRPLDPLGAIGAYWATTSTPSPADVAAVQAIADATAVTMERLRSDEALAGQLDELARANRALEDANEQLRRMGSVVAHDLRWPLATVDGLLSLLTRQLERGDTSAVSDLAGRATAQVRRLMDSVEALMSLSQARTDPLELEQIELSALVAEVVAGLDAEVSAASAEVRADAGILVGDRVLLRLLLQNLIANAVRFQDPHRPQLVEVGLTRRGPGRELSVTDRGVGLDPDALEELFVPTRVREVRRGQRHGTGIGLLTCRRIAERHGGSIKAEPQADGARFVVWLPDSATTERLTSDIA